MRIHMYIYKIRKMFKNNSLKEYEDINISFPFYSLYKVNELKVYWCFSMQEPGLDEEHLNSCFLLGWLLAFCPFFCQRQLAQRIRECIFSPG